jgi:hypothetical protein
MPKVVRVCRCCYCGAVIQKVEFTVHKYHQYTGPEVPLCRTCAEDDEITTGDIWWRNVHPLVDRPAKNSRMRR